MFDQKKTRASHKTTVILPPIPAKVYFSIGEAARLCCLKPHVLRYWEQEFPSLQPVKRRGNRRYYQHQDLLLIRRIRRFLYDEGFTIDGARQKLEQSGGSVYAPDQSAQVAAAIARLAALSQSLED